MTATEEPTKSLAATDGAVGTRWCEAIWRNQPIVKTLVIPFPVGMRRECGERSAQVGVAEDDDPIHALLLDRPNEALRIRTFIDAKDAPAPRPSMPCPIRIDIRIRRSWHSY